MADRDEALEQFRSGQRNIEHAIIDIYASLDLKLTSEQITWSCGNPATRTPPERANVTIAALGGPVTTIAFSREQIEDSHAGPHDLGARTVLQGLERHLKALKSGKT